MKKFFIDYRTSEEEKSFLLALGHECLVCPPSPNLYQAVCGHPDILLHIIDNNIIMVHKETHPTFIKELEKLSMEVIISSSKLGSSYPHNVILNGVSTTEFFMHNLKYTDSTLLNHVRKEKKMINVKQGYTKCSTAIVNSHAFMTSDTGIAKALHQENFDVLLLPPGDIDLPGLNYGFIGGCCGLIEDNLLAFFGELEHYAYGKEVLSFLKKHKVEPYALKKGRLTDRGSLLSIDN